MRKVSCRSLENFPSLEESADKLRKSIEQLKQREDEIKKQVSRDVRTFGVGKRERKRTFRVEERE